MIQAKCLFVIHQSVIPKQTARGITDHHIRAFTAGALAFEVFEIISEPFLAALLIALGYLAAILLHHSLPETHHHHDGG